MRIGLYLPSLVYFPFTPIDLEDAFCESEDRFFIAECPRDFLLKYLLSVLSKNPRAWVDEDLLHILV